MKRVLWGIEAVLVIIFAVILTNHICNERLIDRYSHDIYEENNFAFLGFLQPYIAPYNQGNLYYQREDYASAIEKYQQALKYNPPEGYDCQIRINEVLAMLATFDEDAVTVDTYDESIEYLKSAQTILCENGCASFEGKGHNADAQKLKEDIDDCIFRLGVKVSFIKNDENGDPLSGAKLQVLDSDEQVLYEWTSNGKEYTEIRFLIGSSYIYREVEAPEGYNEAQDITFTVNEDGTVSYDGQEEQDNPDVSGNEVVMVDSKDENQSSSGGGGQGGGGGGQGGGQQNGGQGGEEQQTGSNQGDAIEQQLQEIQEQSQQERVEEMGEDEHLFDFDYNTGATW